MSAWEGDENTKERAERDWYQTPPGIVKKLLDVLNLDMNAEFYVWENAAGNGAMVDELNKDSDWWIVGSDVVPRRDDVEQVDFMADRKWFTRRYPRLDMIVTNPPFSLINEWILRSLSVLGRGGLLCILARLQLLEGVKREKLIFSVERPRWVYVMTKRVSMWRMGIDPAGSGKEAYAWFVWERGWKGDTVVRWIV